MLTLSDADKSVFVSMEQYLLEINDICDYLQTLDEYSDEGFGDFLKSMTIKISDLAASMVKITITNIATLSGKRSEIRAYVDRYAVSCKLIENLSYDKVMNIKVPKPTGMKVKYIEVTEWIKAGYENSVFRAIDSMKKDLKKILVDVQSSTTSKTFSSKMSVSTYMGYYKTLADKIAKLVDAQHKLFQKDDGHTNMNTEDLEFKKLYSTMKEFKAVTNDLLSTSSNMIKSLKIEKQSEPLSDTIKDIVDSLEVAEFKPTKAFVTDLAFIVRTMAVTLDLIGTVVKTEMITEHNHIAVYNQLDNILHTKE